MKRFLCLAGVLLVCGCPDSAPPGEMTNVDAGAGPGGLKACIDRPAALPRPPGGTLPCELLPPTFGAAQSPAGAK